MTASMFQQVKNKKPELRQVAKPSQFGLSGSRTDNAVSQQRTLDYSIFSVLSER